MSKFYLVTGVAGFIASHLCRRLLADDPQCVVVGVDKGGYCSSERNFEDIIATHNSFNTRFVYHIADVCNIEAMNALFRKYSFDAVLHLAAETHVDNSFGNSLQFTHSNVYGTHVLLEMAKKYSVRRFIHMSTDEVYGDSESMSSEQSSLEPTNPYAATKVAAEYLVKSYHRSFALPAIIIRGNNIYGPNQFPEKMIPRFILRLKSGLPCTIHGDGKQRRSWLYVQDAVEAITQVLHKGDVGQVYNIGTDPSSECDVNTIASMLIAEIFPSRESETQPSGVLLDSIFVTHVGDRCFNDKRYLIDSTKLYEKTGWKPKVSLKEGLRRTVEWYSRVPYRQWWDPVEVTRALK